MGITELQEQVDVSVQIGITLQQVAQQARNERNQKGFGHLLARRRRRDMYSQLGKVGCAVERLGGVGKKMSGHKSGITNAELRLKASSGYKAE